MEEKQEEVEKRYELGSAPEVWESDGCQSAGPHCQLIINISEKCQQRK
jgi:hypothetical protein